MGHDQAMRLQQQRATARVSTPRAAHFIGVLRRPAAFVVGRQLCRRLSAQETSSRRFGLGCVTEDKLEVAGSRLAHKQKLLKGSVLAGKCHYAYEHGLGRSYFNASDLNRSLIRHFEELGYNNGIFCDELRQPVRS